MLDLFNTITFIVYFVNIFILHIYQFVQIDLDKIKSIYTKNQLSKILRCKIKTILYYISTLTLT